MKGWLAAEIDKAGGPKAVALELRRAGYPSGSEKPYSERTVASWREKNDNWPPSGVLWAISQLNASSQDVVVLEGHLRRTLIERLQDQDGRVKALEELTDVDHQRLDFIVAAVVRLAEAAGLDVLNLEKREQGVEGGD